MNSIESISNLVANARSQIFTNSFRSDNKINKIKNEKLVLDNKEKIKKLQFENTDSMISNIKNISDNNIRDKECLSWKKLISVVNENNIKPNQCAAMVRLSNISLKDDYAKHKKSVELLENDEKFNTNTFSSSIITN